MYNMIEPTISSNTSITIYYITWQCDGGSDHHPDIPHRSSQLIIVQIKLL